MLLGVGFVELADGKARRRGHVRAAHRYFLRLTDFLQVWRI